MSWLNWSMKFHIRLRTISHLVPTHITHVYVQWMPYSFVRLYLIKCGIHTQSYVDQTQKDFWIFLVVFGKSFCFEKFQQIQNLCNSILATDSQVKPVTRPQSWAYLEALTTLWRVSPPVAKNIYKFFQNFSIFGIFATQFGDLFVSGSSNCELTQKDSQHPSWLVREWTFQSQKTLRQNYQNFV